MSKGDLGIKPRIISTQVVRRGGVNTEFPYHVVV